MSYWEKLSYFLKSKPSLKFAAAFTVIFIVAATLIILFKNPQSIKEGDLRGTEEEKIQMISPREEIQELPMAFEWQPVLGAKEYQVILLDEELTRTWTSDKIDKTKVPIPSEIRNRLIQEKIYYWKIVIYFENGIQEESDLQKFILTKNPR